MLYIKNPEKGHIFTLNIKRPRKLQDDEAQNLTASNTFLVRHKNVTRNNVMKYLFDCLIFCPWFLHEGRESEQSQEISATKLLW